MASDDIFTSMEYINEDSIDSNLICSICQKPFKEPVCTSCDHTYCKQCITRWLTSNKTKSCPTCMKQPLSTKELVQASRPLRNMIDQLRVRCVLCEQADLQRGNFLDHIDKICPKTTTGCQAADIKCPWKGTREELPAHLPTCIFEPLRPILGYLIAENNQLKKKIEQQANEIKKLRGETPEKIGTAAAAAVAVDDDSDAESIISSTSEMCTDDTNQKEENAIFVRNLPANVKFNDVFDFFSKIGRIKYDPKTQKASLFIFKNPNNANGPCAAKVTYVDKESASAAIGEYDQKHIPQWNTKLLVCISTRKKAHFKDAGKEHNEAKGTHEEPLTEQDKTPRTKYLRRPHHSKQSHKPTN
ncbi:unnamed protein product [Adineta ricciae]|uniref:RING-type domain-containing protein n=1 Tax=Adineta ricciae TaxID=249248 RepID=A0A814AK76_ADIRI|nr:unnamed protein product [Adineta ricciae]